MRHALRSLVLATIPLITIFFYLFKPTFSIIANCIILMVIFGALFSLNYYQYLPIVRKNEDYTNNILGILFKVLESEIVALRPQYNNLRINVMRVRRRFIKPWERYLKIDYHYGNYSNPELDQIYGLNMGCCGVALFENSQIYYDSILQHQTLLHMTPTQQTITFHVKSILSTPIYSPNDAFEHNPIAILNLDSIDSISVTGFDDTLIQEIAANFTTLMNRQLM